MTSQGQIAGRRSACNGVISESGASAVTARMYAGTPGAAIGGPCSAARSASRSQYLDDPGASFTCRDVQVGNCHWQVEPSRACAAGVYELDAVTFRDKRLMRMAGNDDLEAGSPRVDVELLDVVKDVNADSLQLKGEIKRDLCRPRAFVVVSPDRVNRRNGT